MSVVKNLVKYSLVFAVLTVWSMPLLQGIDRSELATTSVVALVSAGEPTLPQEAPSHWDKFADHDVFEQFGMSGCWEIVS